jgi:hypothetical protein
LPNVPNLKFTLSTDKSIMRNSKFTAQKRQPENRANKCRTLQMSHGAGWREPCACTDRDRQ